MGSQQDTAATSMDSPLHTLRVTELDHVDAARRFRTLADLPWPVWLDSAADPTGKGRFDVLAADPYLTLRARGASTEVVTRDGVASTSSRSPLALLREFLGPTITGAAGLPFCGGAIGYVGYDFGRRCESVPTLATADIDMPDVAMGLYDWAVVIDHAERRSWLVGGLRDERTHAQWSALIQRLGGKPTIRLAEAMTPQL